MFEQHISQCIISNTVELLLETFLNLLVDTLKHKYQKRIKAVVSSKEPYLGCWDRSHEENSSDITSTYHYSYLVIYFLGKQK